MSDFQNRVDNDMKHVNGNIKRVEVATFMLACALIGLGVGVFITPYWIVQVIQAVGFIHICRYIKPMLKSRAIVNAQFDSLNGMKEDKVWTADD